jgi:hypothetical protein
MWETCPWGHEGEVVVFCYECHEEMLHNPVILPDDLNRFAELVRRRGLSEQVKNEGRSLIAGRIRLFQEVIALGIATALAEENDDSLNEPSKQTGDES